MNISDLNLRRNGKRRWANFTGFSLLSPRMRRRDEPWTLSLFWTMKIKYNTCNHRVVLCKCSSGPGSHNFTNGIDRRTSSSCCCNSTTARNILYVYVIRQLTESDEVTDSDSEYKKTQQVFFIIRINYTFFINSTKLNTHTLQTHRIKERMLKLCGQDSSRKMSTLCPSTHLADGWITTSFAPASASEPRQKIA